MVKSSAVSPGSISAWNGMKFVVIQRVPTLGRSIAVGRKEYLLEVRLIRVPNLISPSIIQSFDRAVLVTQPIAIRSVSGLVLIERPAEFVVDLPADDGWMRTESLRQRRNNSSCGIS